MVHDQRDARYDAEVTENPFEDPTPSPTTPNTAYTHGRVQSAVPLVSGYPFVDASYSKAEKHTVGGAQRRKIPFYQSRIGLAITLILTILIGGAIAGKVAWLLTHKKSTVGSGATSGANTTLLSSTPVTILPSSTVAVNAVSDGPVSTAVV
ncbi:hypothetical protein BD410DRAFT_831584 [Rickenella mellea]|uniref:Uncharacterized protein n=1 Tax=Rickenella mellea TaxID=50990 RepID=A0A4Y7PQA8_9AGAM|nr:hypothetical protein BD410DRAFT_831584 [Rickenella mellea]